jgi:hypothetical protein
LKDFPPAASISLKVGNMKKTIIALAISIVGIAAAKADVAFSISFGGPRVFHPAPVVCAPAPVVVAAPPVVYAPAPVVYAPAPVVCAPAPVVCAPVYSAPVVISRSRYSYYPHYSHGYSHHGRGYIGWRH